MTSSLFADLTEIVADLSRSPAHDDRFNRLIAAFQRSFPCDAVALLQLEGDTLRPLAVHGLGEDTLGRRFVVDEHPRLAEIMSSRHPVRFPADSPLPDPYDGLVDGAHRTTTYTIASALHCMWKGNPGARSRWMP